MEEFSLNTGMNVFITGGGSNLLNLDKYFSNFFGTNVEKIKDNKKGSIKDFDSCFGALKIIRDGWETEAIPENINKNVSKIGFFAKIFGNTG